MAYTMELGKNYLLNTVGGTIINQKVQVAGIISYIETQNTKIDVRIVAINEKVIGAIDLVDNNYLGKQNFYKCFILDPTTNAPYTNSDANIIIVWSDIIDPNKTIVLDSTYNYKTSINVPTNGSTFYPVDSILADAASYIKNKYNATLSFTTMTSEDQNKTIDVLVQRLNDCNTVLKAFQGFVTMVPTLQKLTNSDISTSIDEINTNLAVIQDSVETIASTLG